METKKKYRSYVDIPEQELRYLYYDENLSLKMIAKRYHVSHVTIINRLKEFGMKPRENYSTWKTRSIKYIKEDLQ